MARPLHHQHKLMAEINVTSLVDVSIMLLIMFMIIAPMSQGGIEVRVPQTESAPLPSSEAIVVSMDDDGRVFVDETEIRAEAVGDVLVQIRESRGIGRVYVRADEAISYGRVMLLMGQLSAAGFENVGLITEPLPEER